MSAGIPQTADLTDRKHSKRNVYARNVMVRGKSAKRPDKFGLMSPFRENKVETGAKTRKSIKKVMRCILHCPI